MVSAWAAHPRACDGCSLNRALSRSRYRSGMTTRTDPTRFFAVQNAASALVFGAVAATHASAWLLSLDPRSEWLWFTTIRLNRLTSPVLETYYSWAPAGAVVSLAVLAAICLAPLLAQARKSWLATAVCGHVAFTSIEMSNRFPPLFCSSHGKIVVMSDHAMCKMKTTSICTHSCYVRLYRGMCVCMKSA